MILTNQHTIAMAAAEAMSSLAPTDRKRKRDASWEAEVDVDVLHPRKVMRLDGDSHNIQPSPHKPLPEELHAPEDEGDYLPSSDESAPSSPLKPNEALPADVASHRRRSKEILLEQIDDFEHRLYLEKEALKSEDQKAPNFVKVELMLDQIHRLAEELRHDLHFSDHMFDQMEVEPASESQMLSHLPPAIKKKLAGRIPSSFAVPVADGDEMMCTTSTTEASRPSSLADTLSSLRYVPRRAAAAAATSLRTAEAKPTITKAKKAKLSQLRITKNSEPLVRPDPRYLDTSSSSKKDVALYILKREARPMRVKEMAEIGLAEGLLMTKGKTPWETMRRDINADILQKGNESLFVKVDSSLFGLREWFNEDGSK